MGPLMPSGPVADEKPYCAVEFTALSGELASTQSAAGSKLSTCSNANFDMLPTSGETAAFDTPRLTQFIPIGFSASGQVSADSLRLKPPASGKGSFDSLCSETVSSTTPSITPRLTQ